MRALEYGFCALEKVWDNRDGMLSVRKWNEAEQWRVKILVNDNGDFRGFRYYTPWGAPVDIPPEKAFVWAYNSEYGNLYGTPYTASIYSLWIAKETIMLDVLRFYEKWGGLNVVIKYPPRPVLDDDGNVVKDENQDTAEEIGQTLRSNSIITMPNEVDANGNPIWQIEEYLSSTKDKGADYREFLTYLDKRILNVIDKAHKNGANTGILSEANEIRISKTLVKSGYRDVFDFIVANKIKFKGESVEEFCLDIHRNKDKYLKQIMDEYKLNPEETAYIGDNENDEPCFEMVGYPVVAFMAGEDFKEKCSKKYGAFIPEGGKDLHDFLCRG